MPRLLRAPGSARAPIAVAAVVVLAVAVAIPVLAASPAPSAGPANGNGNGHGADKSHEPEVQVTLRGLVSATTSSDGETGYAITADGRTLRLEAGPPWYWGDKNPLKAAVGKTVTIVGEQSGDEVDVQSIDGTAIRPAGKPPWAGGWKVVGSSHPGWSQAKADRMKDKIAAKQQREAAKATCRAAGTCADGEPEESEAPAPSPS